MLVGAGLTFVRFSLGWVVTFGALLRPLDNFSLYYIIPQSYLKVKFLGKQGAECVGCVLWYRMVYCYVTLVTVVMKFWEGRNTKIPHRYAGFGGYVICYVIFKIEGT